MRLRLYYCLSVAVVLVALIGTAIQWLIIVEQATHAIWNRVKFADHTPLDAGRETLGLFIAMSLALAGIAWLATLIPATSPFIRRAGHFLALASAAGLLLWLLLVASPLVQLARP